MDAIRDEEVSMTALPRSLALISLVAAWAVIPSPLEAQIPCAGCENLGPHTVCDSTPENEIVYDTCYMTEDEGTTHCYGVGLGGCPEFSYREIEASSHLTVLGTFMPLSEALVQPDGDWLRNACTGYVVAMGGLKGDAIPTIALR
ncbi:MAG: hypothetical protein RLN75_05435 [Longimicrobiales bacterium]